MCDRPPAPATRAAASRDAAALQRAVTVHRPAPLAGLARRRAPRRTRASRRSLARRAAPATEAAAHRATARRHTLVAWATRSASPRRRCAASAAEVAEAGTARAPAVPARRVAVADLAAAAAPAAAAALEEPAGPRGWRPTTASRTLALSVEVARRHGARPCAAPTVRAAVRRGRVRRSARSEVGVARCSRPDPGAVPRVQHEPARAPKAPRSPARNAPPRAGSPRVAGTPPARSPASGPVRSIHRPHLARRPGIAPPGIVLAHPPGIVLARPQGIAPEPQAGSPPRE